LACQGSGAVQLPRKKKGRPIIGKRGACTNPIFESKPKKRGGQFGEERTLYRRRAEPGNKDRLLYHLIKRKKKDLGVE